MAELYSRIMPDEKNVVTRTAHRKVTSRLETWDGEIKTELHADGFFRVYIGEKDGANTLIANGNVNTLEFDVSKYGVEVA